MAHDTTTGLDGHLLGAVPPGGRVLVLSAGLTDAAATVAALADRGHEVLVAEGELPAAGSGRVEVVVAGTAVAATRHPAALLDAVAELLEPAGVLLATVPTGLAAAGTRNLGAVTTSIEAAGWSVERTAPAVVASAAGPGLAGHLVVARRAWTPDDLLRAGSRLATTDARADVRVLVLGEADPSQLVALRASLPERTTVAPVGFDDDLDADELVLVLGPDLLPQPDWVAALLAAAADGPVGVRVVDQTGRVVHAGAADDGRPFAVGAPDLDVPVLTVDRPDARLLPPFVARARDLGGDGPVRGRYLGTHAATSLAVDAAEPTGPQVGLTEVFDRTALVVLDGSPLRLAGAAAAGFDRTLDALLAAGVVPVVHWSDDAPVATRGALGHLERRGVVLVGGSAAEAPDEDDQPVVSPHPHALVGALSPEVLVFGDRAQLEGNLPLCLAADRRGLATVLIGDPDGDGRADDARAADLFAPWSSPTLGADLLALTARDRAVAGRRVAVVAPRERRVGVVSVVIPVWNRWDLTERCLDSLARHAEAPLEIVVVDNGSRDGTAPGLAERAARGELVVVTNETNLGFPRACNQGMAVATGELVCILNNDTEVTPGWLREMIAALAVPGTGMVGPRTNQISGPQIVPDAPALAEDPASIAAAHAWAEGWTAPRAGRGWRIRRLVGFCLLLRGDVLEEVGAFDEGYGIGNYEDDDLCRRVLASGRTLRVADGALVLHHCSATFRALGVAYSVSLREARRHVDHAAASAPAGGSDLLGALVLADGEPAAALASALTASTVADRVRVVERRGLAVTQLAVAFVPVGVDVVDPAAERASSAWPSDHPVDHVLVLAAGEVLEVAGDDWGRVRHAVERAGADPAGVLVDGVAQARLLGPGAPLACVGDEPDWVLTAATLRTNVAPPRAAVPVEEPAPPPTFPAPRDPEPAATILADALADDDGPGARPLEGDGAEPDGRVPLVVLREAGGDADEGVNVVGFFNAETGEGEVARQVVEVLRAGDIPYRAFSITEGFNRQDHPFADLGDTSRVFDSTVVCLGMNALPAFAAHDVGRHLLERGPSVAIWPWEVEAFPMELADRAAGVDEIWGISRHGCVGLRAALRVPVQAFTLPVPLLDLPTVPSRTGTDPFTFLFCFSYWSVMPRKNPVGAITAFTRAFAPGDGARLVIKSINGDQHPAALAEVRAAAAGRPDIEVSDGYLDAAEQRRLVASCDAYVSLHRAEGFGFTLAEAMGLGKPVVASAYSGNLDYMTHETSLLVPTRRVRVPAGCEPYPTTCQWGDPDLDHAAAAMRQLWQDPAAAAVGRLARAHVRAHHAPANRVAFVRERLAALRAQRQEAFR